MAAELTCLINNISKLTADRGKIERSSCSEQHFTLNGPFGPILGASDALRHRASFTETKSNIFRTIHLQNLIQI